LITVLRLLNSLLLAGDLDLIDRLLRKRELCQGRQGQIVIKVEWRKMGGSCVQLFFQSAVPLKVHEKESRSFCFVVYPTLQSWRDDFHQFGKVAALKDSECVRAKGPRWSAIICPATLDAVVLTPGPIELVSNRRESAIFKPYQLLQH